MDSLSGIWPNFGSPGEQSSLHNYGQSPNLGELSPVGSSISPGLASILPFHLSSPVKISPIGKDPTRTSLSNQVFTNGIHGAAYQQHFSVPDPKICSSPGGTSSFSDSKPSSVGTLSGPQFLWGSPTIHPDHINSSAFASQKGRLLPSRVQKTSFLQHGSLLGSHHLHVGSAPSGIQMERHFGFFPNSPESSYMNQATFGVPNYSHTNGNRVPAAMNLGVGYGGNFTESGSPSSRMMSMSRNGPMYFGGMGSPSNDGIIDRGRRRAESGSQMDNKRQYQLDLEKIRIGEDTRTTLMIKNIPNK